MKNSKKMFLKRENRVTMEEDTDTEAYYDQEGPIGQGVGLEDACPHDLDIEPVNEREVMNIKEEGELNNSEGQYNVESLSCYLLEKNLMWSLMRMEKCSFDDPEYRRESVMKHAQREKSKKASESRAHQKMPHYNGTKSFAHLRDEIRQTNDGKCSRVDVLVASRTRKSKKAVNVLTLEKNTLAVEQRDQGLNDKIDEQIFQDVLGKDTYGYLRAYGPSKKLIEVKKKANQLIEEVRKDAENARMEAEKAKKEAEAIRNDVDRKIEQNNAIWEKNFHQLMNFIKGGTYSNDDDSGNESSS
ncbi:putative GTP-binding protein EngB [Bienertia sinuspersici]